MNAQTKSVNNTVPSACQMMLGRCLPATLPALSLLMFTSCGQPATRVASERELVGRWSLVELKTPQGHRGPAAGILKGEFVLKADGSITSRLQWSTNANGMEQPVVTSDGNWILSNRFLICRTGTNAAPAKSRVGFEGDLLVIESGGKTALTYYLSNCLPALDP